jgi:hypothetical protein
MAQESREIQLPAPSDLPAYKALANTKRRLVKNGSCLLEIKKQMKEFLDGERTNRKATTLEAVNTRGGNVQVEASGHDDDVSPPVPSDDDDLEEAVDSLLSIDGNFGGGHFDGSNYDGSDDSANDGGDGDGNGDGDGSAGFEDADFDGHELATSLYRFLGSTWSKKRKPQQVNVLVKPVQNYYSFVCTKLATSPRPFTSVQLGSATTFNEFLASMTDASPGKRLAAVNTHLALLEFLISGCGDEDNKSRSLLTTFTSSVLKMKSHVSTGRTRLNTSSFNQQSSPEDSVTEEQVMDSARVMVDWYLTIQPRVTAICNKARDSGFLTAQVTNQHEEA